VDFLNSVIVDQQRKKELLQARLQVMESSSLSLTDSVNDTLVKYDVNARFTFSTGPKHAP